MKKFPAILTITAATAASLFAAFFLFLALPFRVDLTGSLNHGLFWESSNLDLRRGEVVLVCVPRSFHPLAFERGYWSLSDKRCDALLAKTILALPGDAVALSDAGTQVNGHPVPRSAPTATDSLGRALPTLRGTFVMPPGMYWLDNSHPASYGSRYCGPFPRDYLLAHLEPLISP